MLEWECRGQVVEKSEGIWKSRNSQSLQCSCNCNYWQNAENSAWLQNSSKAFACNLLMTCPLYDRTYSNVENIPAVRSIWKVISILPRYLHPTLGLPRRVAEYSGHKALWFDCRCWPLLQRQQQQKDFSGCISAPFQFIVGSRELSWYLRAI